MGGIEKFILKLVRPQLEKKIKEILNNRVLFYEIIKRAIELLLEQEDIKNTIKRAKIVGIDIDPDPDKLSVFILNLLRKKGIKDKLEAYIIGILEEKLK